MSLSTIRFWVAMLLLFDVAIGLLGLDYWQRFIPSINIRRMILIEAVAAIVILVIHFLTGAQVKL